jgi:hypothetical protein
MATGKAFFRLPFYPIIQWRLKTRIFMVKNLKSGSFLNNHRQEFCIQTVNARLTGQVGLTLNRNLKIR